MPLEALRAAGGMLVRRLGLTSADFSVGLVAIAARTRTIRAGRRAPALKAPQFHFSGRLIGRVGVYGLFVRAIVLAAVLSPSSTAAHPPG
jgi:hypothetical protein